MIRYLLLQLEQRTPERRTINIITNLNMMTMMINIITNQATASMPSSPLHTQAFTSPTAQHCAQHRRTTSAHAVFGRVAKLKYTFHASATTFENST
jgi:hypothetical protein